MQDNLTTKTCLLVGLKSVIAEETKSHITSKNIKVFIATNLLEVKEILPRHPVNIVIMGAGLELRDRLSIVQYIFENSDTITVHMKDRASGSHGFVGFINNVLDGFLKDR
ncbi:MAG: hypothetical protein ABIS36_16885 [Chryseolinea sp.]